MGIFSIGLGKAKKSVISGSNSNSIGVAGALNRMGTTTQCLQICKYLISMGYTVAYVEMNKNEFIDDCEKTYSKAKKKGKYLLCNGIDMYKGLADAMSGDYDYLIKDYGDMQSDKFNSISFLEQGTRVICLGSKPTELTAADTVLDKDEYIKSKFIFTFVPESEHKDILELMLDSKDSTYFAPYTPDLFNYNSEESNKIYSSLLGIDTELKPDTDNEEVD